MALNDILIVDGWVKKEMTINPILSEGEAFENVSMSILCKKLGLSKKEIDTGSVDGHNDGGIDFIFFFVDGYFINNKEDVRISKKPVIDIYIVQCKRHDTFEQDVLSKLHSSLTELLDLQVSTENLKASFNDEIYEKRELLVHIYSLLALNDPKVNVHIQYVSRGDTELIAENVSSKAQLIESMIKNYFSNSSSKFEFYGARELVNENRNKNNGKEKLKVVKYIVYDDHIIAICNIFDYYEFIKDKAGKLKRSYFEENVRDYLGNNRTNSDILETLESTDLPDFWLMNNGITLIVDKLFGIGENITISNVQIVNGLQTSNTIYNYFKKKSKRNINEKRSVLLKIVKKKDESMKNVIIQSTNNQSPISLGSLLSVDKAQKDIEEYLLNYGYYYERRTREYINQDKDSKLIFTPLQLASMHVALVLKMLHSSTILKEKKLKLKEKYDAIYNDGTSLQVWLQSARLIEKLERNHTDLKNKEKKLLNTKIIIPLTSFFLVSLQKNSFNFTREDICKLKVEDLADADIQTVMLEISQFLNQSPLEGKEKINENRINDLVYYISKKFQIDDPRTITKRTNKAFRGGSKRPQDKDIEEIIHHMAQVYPTSKITKEKKQKFFVQNNEKYSEHKCSEAALYINIYRGYKTKKIKKKKTK